MKNDPVNWTDPSGLDRRRCSRNLSGSPVKAGTLRHDYAQFRDSKGNITTKSWGNNGMISEAGDAKGLQCEGWNKSSDKADSAAMDLANNLNDLVDYDLLNYNCQDYSTDVLNFQQGR